jgi:steroid 5-alpha reductase family enzyme
LYLGRDASNGVSPEVSSRQQLVTTMGLMWCTRLGSFLFERVHKTGKDSRFDKIKHQPSKFAFFWFMQGLWCFLVGMPVYLTNTDYSGVEAQVDWKDYVGRALFLVGWLWESIADYQKSEFKDAHPSDFMSSGLFAFSRYPNYFGEIALQTGLFLSCVNGISDPKMKLISAASPIFTYWLLTRVSGIPPLEKSSQAKYGSNKTFQEYFSSTNMLFPWFPKSKS